MSEGVVDITFSPDVGYNPNKTKQCSEIKLCVIKWNDTGKVKNIVLSDETKIETIENLWKELKI